ncbi:MAG: ABC transporter permease [Bryobacterales bacterium]|nr:ABC transporter permease [Bryobacterales bacterium]
MSWRYLKEQGRSLRREPLFTTFVVLLLAVGIGANTLIFTAVNALLLRPLPIAHPESLVRLGVSRSPALTSFDHPYLYARVVGSQAHSFSGVFSTWTVDIGLTSGNRIENMAGETVSGDYFAVLGLKAERGRLLDSGDEQNDATTAVLSHAFWNEHFGGTADIIGRSIRLRGHLFTVVGIAPKAFTGLDLDSRTDVWVPMSAGRIWAARRDISRTPAHIYFRIKPDVSMPKAEAEIRALYPAMVIEYASGVAAYTTGDIRHEQALQPSLESVEYGVSALRKTFGRAAALLLVAVSILLLLVCANVGGLLFARGQAKAHDIAVRISVGATPGDLFQRGICEGLAMALAGTAIGWVIARLGAPLLLSMLPQRHPLSVDLTPDWRIICFAALACMTTTILVGLLPAWVAARSGISVMPGRSSIRVQRSRVAPALVAAQVALATVLGLIGISLVRTLNRLRGQDPGFRRERVIVLDVNPRIAGLKSDDLPGSFREATRRIESLPGVTGVGVAERSLMRGVGYKVTAGPAGTRPSSADAMNISANGVSENYFALLGMRIIEGRGFEPGDNRRKPRPAIVSKSFASKFFPGVSPIGRLFGTGHPGQVIPPAREIVGVVNDAKYRSMRESPPPTAYSLLDMEDVKFSDGLSLYVLAGKADPDRIAERIREALAGIGPGLAASSIAALEQEIQTSLWQERLLAALSAGFAAVALLLATAGLFGALAMSVAKRTSEIGLRVALGATAPRIAAMIGVDATLSVVPGIAFGFGVYAVTSRALAGLLFTIGIWDPVSSVVVLASVLVLSAIAALAPVARATSIHPVEALRME